MKNIIINTVIILILSILPLNISKVHAYDFPYTTCEMTIYSSKHTSMEKTANATGDCNGLVWGFYHAPQDAFNIFGMTNYEVEYSGQEFVMGTPAGKHAQAVLTVYTVKEESKPDKPKEEPNEESKEESKEEPKEESKPTKPVEKPKEKTTPVKQESREETKETTQPKTETKTQDTSVSIVKKTEETKKPAISKSSETEQDAERKTAETTEKQEVDKIKPPEVEVDQVVGKEEKITEELEEDEEVASKSTEIKSETESDFPVLLTFVIGIVVIGLAGFGVRWFKLRKMKS